MNKHKIISATIAISMLFGSVTTVSAHENNNGDRASWIATLQQQIAQLQAQLDILKANQLNQGTTTVRNKEDREKEERNQRVWAKCIKEYNKKNKSWRKNHHGDNAPKYCRGYGYTPGNSGGNSSTTPDTTTPIISSIVVGNISANGATITWNTNELAASQVSLSATSPVSTGTAVWSDAILRTSHSAALGSLATNTTYYFIIRATDAANNAGFSAQSSFVTSNTADTIAPVVSNIIVSSVSTSSATITWGTNELSNARLYVGSTSPIGTTSAVWGDNNFSTTHGTGLNGLLANTTYYYVIEANDASANKSFTSQGSFVTAAIAADVTPPVISAVATSSVTQTGATVTWTTNELSNSRVYYSTTTPVFSASTAQAMNASNVTSHSIPLTGLAASSTYYALVVSSDAANNTATSSQLWFTTLP